MSLSIGFAKIQHNDVDALKHMLCSYIDRIAVALISKRWKCECARDRTCVCKKCKPVPLQMHSIEIDRVTLYYKGP